MRNRDENLETELTTITEHLVQLRIQQDRLERRLTTIQEQIGTRDRGVNPPSKGVDQHHHDRTNNNIVNVAREIEYNNSDNTPNIGDNMRIVNPKRGQQRFGVIVGFCRDGKLKVQTANREIITRLPKNTRHII